MATGPTPTPTDPDWAHRVARHKQRRPAQWHTLETTDITTALHTIDTAILWDDVGTWVTALLDHNGAWTTDVSTWRPAIDRAVDELLGAWSQRTAGTIAVSPEVGLGVIPATPGGRLFRDVVGEINQALAHHSDETWFFVAGQATRLQAPPW